MNTLLHRLPRAARRVLAVPAIHIAAHIAARIAALIAAASLPLSAGAAPVLRNATLPTGVTLQYTEQGPATGPAVILLHGITDSLRSFDPPARHWPRHLRVIAVSQRGHGGSGRPAAGYRPADFAADIAALADQLGIDRALVVGHSMGATVAMRFAIDHPARTRGLVLVGAFAGFDGDNAAAEFYRQDIVPLTDPVPRKLAHEFQVATFAGKPDRRYLKLVVDESLRVPARVWRDAFAGLLEDDTGARAIEIRAPALLLHGDRDAFVPYAHQDRLLAAIARSRHVGYRGIGHALHWEAPRRFVADVVAFERTLDDAGLLPPHRLSQGAGSPWWELTQGVRPCGPARAIAGPEACTRSD